MKRDWPTYFEQTKNHPPRPLLVKALEFVKNRDSAFDLGSGALNDCVFLLKENFQTVTAVDKKPVAMQIAETLPKESFRYVISSLEDYSFPTNAADLVNAQFSLPFIKPEHFDEVWGCIRQSLKNGGVFVGQLFGDRDEWRTKADMTFHTEDQVRQLLSPFDTLFFKEEEEDKPTADGVVKHWHIFHFIVRK